MPAPPPTQRPPDALRRFPRGRTAAALLVSAAAVATLQREPAPRPAPAAIRPAAVNVLLISVDTLRADRVNAQGYTRRRTSPTLDALARDGILFENAIAAAPWTTPSHLSLFTSLVPSHHGVVASFSDMQHALEGRGLVPRLASEHVTLAEALAATGRTTAAFTGGATLDARLGFDQGFATYDTSLAKLSPPRLRRVFDWIDTQGTRPFFLFVHTFEVHAPYLDATFLDDVLPPERARRLGRALSRLARRAGEVGVAESTTDGLNTLAEHQALTREVCDALYDGGVLSFDRHLACLLAFLRARGLYDRTLIVVTSDHGEELGERGRGFYNFHGQSLYEEMVHVPLIVKLPGQAAAGRRVSAVVSALDVLPTVLDVVGAPPLVAQAEGVSLRPLWEGGAPEPGERLALSEALSKGPEQKSLRSATDKLILTVEPRITKERGRGYLPDEGTRRALFDLVHDHDERRSRLEDPASGTGLRARADALETELRRRLATRTGRAEEVALDRSTVEGLRALGYIEDDTPAGPSPD